MGYISRLLFFVFVIFRLKNMLLKLFHDDCSKAVKLANIFTEGWNRGGGVLGGEQNLHL